MQDITQWLLVNVFSPLLLPLILVGTLCLLADIRPEPVVNGVLRLVGEIIKLTFGLLVLLLKTVTGAGRGRK